MTLLILSHVCVCHLQLLHRPEFVCDCLVTAQKTHTHTQTHTYTNTHIHKQTCTHTHIHTRIHAHTCKAHAHMHAHSCIHRRTADYQVRSYDPFVVAQTFMDGVEASGSTTEPAKFVNPAGRYDQGNHRLGGCA